MNIVISAVGGQGALFAARVIGTLALCADLVVKVSEVHGMSQRGGSVITHVRYGAAVASPIVEEGSADILIAFEMLEAGRYAPFLRAGGAAIINDQAILPMPVLSGKAFYPTDIVERFAAAGIVTRHIDGQAIATAAGNARAVNAVMLGCAASFMDFTIDQWTAAIRAVSPAKFADANVAAFNKGYSLQGAAS